MTTLPETRPARASTCPLHRLFDIPCEEPGRTESAAAHTAPAQRTTTTLAGIAAFAYGLVAYAAFFGTFNYLIGFVGNWFVPRSIDIGPASSIPEAVLVNSSILALFVLQHTIMARPWFKAWWTRVIPASIERSTYVLAASTILALLCWQWRPIPQIVWKVDNLAAGWALTSLSIFGWVMGLASSAMVSHFDLFGLRQVAFRLLEKPYRPVGFRLVGLYRLVRHPLMVGLLIAFWATPVMTLGHLLFATLTTAYIFFGTWVEERDLIAEHGESYLSYRRRVRGFIPIPVAGHSKDAA